MNDFNDISYEVGASEEEDTLFNSGSIVDIEAEFSESSELGVDSDSDFSDEIIACG